LVAGVALAFAMNPLLGVGAVAAAAAVLSGANALAKRDDVSTKNLGVPKNIVTDYGAYVPPEFKIEPNKIPQFMGTAPTPGGSTRSPSGEILGAASATELEKRSTDGISPTAAKAELDQLRAEMKVLTKQSEALEKQNTYNITVNGAIDSESTARQIVGILNDSQARGTLGSAAFR
jgi:hypothetical protein